MKSKLLIILCIPVIAALLASCGSVPQQQIDAAQSAVDSVKTMGADVYVPQEFAALQDSLTAVKSRIEITKSKMFKNFDKEKAELDSVISYAQVVSANSDQKKNEVMAEVKTNIDNIKAMMTENNELIVKAPKGKEGASALEAMKAEMTAIDSSLVESDSLYNNSSYMAALDKTRAASEKATAINTELKEAIAKYSKNKKR